MMMSTAVTTTLEQFRSLFPGSPKAERLAEAFLDDQEQARRAERAALVATRKRLIASLTAAHRAREAPRAQELAEIERIQALVDAARATHQERESTFRQGAYDIERQISLGETRFKLTASPLIEDLVRAAFEERHRTSSVFRDEIHERRIDGSSTRTWTNAVSLDARAEAIGVLIDDVRGWYLEDESDATLQARYDARIAALPAIEERPEVKQGWLS